MSVNLSTNPDRRVQRTRRALREALVALMVERDWDAISVQDVCDRADVGRSTFYTHFTDKDELLAAGFEELGKMVRGPRGGGGDKGRLGFLRALIDHADEHRPLFRALIGRQGGHHVFKKFRHVVVGLVQGDLAGTLPDRARAGLVVHYVAGALVEMLSHWIDANHPQSPEEIERLFRKLTAPVLAAARAE